MDGMEADDLEAWEEERGGGVPGARARLLAARLAPHQVRFEEMDEAYVRMHEVERRIAMLEAELTVGRERIRRLTAELYDGLMVELIDRGLDGGRGESGDGGGRGAA